MDTQTIINILLGLVTFFGGVWVRGIADSMKELKAADSELADKVQHIELLVAGQYVTRDDQDKMMDAIFSKLERIESKIDRHVDK